jgi:hypothetical protein
MLQRISYGVTLGQQTLYRQNAYGAMPNPRFHRTVGLPTRTVKREGVGRSLRAFA